MNLRSISYLGILALLCAPTALQSQASPELPAAPSAVKEQQNAPKKATPPADPPESQTTIEAPVAKPDEGTAAPATPQAPKADAPTEAPAETSSEKSSGSLPAAESSPKASAAKPAPQPDEETIATIRKTVNEVNVVFTVTDKRGRYVKDLKQQDFRILDDNRPAKEIRTFRSETDLPLQVGLLIDASNSVRDRFRFEQEAAIEFLNQIIRHNYDRAFVIGFDNTPEVTQDFTDNSELLSRGVRSLRAGGGTAMYDALYFACRDKLLKEGRTGPTRRAVILLSDGQDNQSRVTREEAIEMAQRAEVIVYSISTNVSGVKQQGDKVLDRIAEATGGRAFFPFQMTDVANAFAEIQDELRSQYLLAYIPEDFRSDGRYRTIQISAAQKQFRVRARRGYYAPSK